MLAREMPGGINGNELFTSQVHALNSSVVWHIIHEIK